MNSVQLRQYLLANLKKDRDNEAKFVKAFSQSEGQEGVKLQVPQREEKINIVDDAYGQERNLNASLAYLLLPSIKDYQKIDLILSDPDLIDEFKKALIENFRTDVEPKLQNMKNHNVSINEFQKFIVRIAKEILSSKAVYTRAQIDRDERIARGLQSENERHKAAREAEEEEGEKTAKQLDKEQTTSHIPGEKSASEEQEEEEDINEYVKRIVPKIVEENKRLLNANKLKDHYDVFWSKEELRKKITVIAEIDRNAEIFHYVYLETCKKIQIAGKTVKNISYPSKGIINMETAEGKKQFEGYLSKQTVDFLRELYNIYINEVQTYYRYIDDPAKYYY
jgi:hypothetical protein